MNFDTLPQQLFGSLLIGAETFVIAALWPVSEWAVDGRRRGGLIVALCVVVLCITLAMVGFVPSMWPPTHWHRLIGRAIGWVPLPLFLGLPAAVCVASGQSLARAGLPARYARASALCMAALAVVAAPLATLGAACGLSGACF